MLGRSPAAPSKPKCLSASRRFALKGGIAFPPDLPDSYFNGRQLTAMVFIDFPAFPSQPSRLCWP